MEGTPFGRYRLIEMLGRGGMGEVWRAHDTATNRTVAIKTLPSHLADDESYVRRFRREAEAAARLNSPHIIPIHDYGEIDGRLYVNMRLIEGRDLQRVLSEGPLAPSRAVRIIEQVAKALHAAHKAGLVHRDVKPSNILLDDDDFAYLIDFGIARATEDTRLTGTGNTIGTFHYLAPERLGDTHDDDARADIYALACVLYECLTGRPPFVGDDMARLVAAHLTTPPPKPSTTHPGVPVTFDDVIATGMAKNPDLRYATTVELASAAHDAVVTPRPSPAPPPATPPQPIARPAPMAATPPPPPGGGYAPPPQPNWNQGWSPPPDSKPHRWWWSPAGLLIAGAIILVLVVTVTAGILLTGSDDDPVKARPSTTTRQTPTAPQVPTIPTSITLEIPSIQIPSIEIPTTASEPSGPETPAPGETLTVSGIAANKTIDCNDGAVAVSGQSNTVVITGRCTSLTVSGIDNTVTVDTVDVINASGIDNKVTFLSGSPQINKSGINTVVEQG